MLQYRTGYLSNFLDETVCSPFLRSMKTARSSYINCNLLRRTCRPNMTSRVCWFDQSQCHHTKSIRWWLRCKWETTLSRSIHYWWKIYILFTQKLVVQMLWNKSYICRASQWSKHEFKPHRQYVISSIEFAYFLLQITFWRV